MPGGLDMGTIFELAGGVVNSIKRGEDGKQGFSVDPQKLGLVLASFAGRQLLARLMSGRQKKETQLEEALALLRERAGIKPKKRGIGAFPLLVIGAAIGAGIYIALMKPEERTALFKQVDKLINEGMSLVNEIQGKPYSADYEKK